MATPASRAARPLLWLALTLLFAGVFGQQTEASSGSQLAAVLEGICKNPGATSEELGALAGTDVTVRQRAPGTSAGQTILHYVDRTGGDVTIVLSLLNGETRRASLAYAQPFKGAPEPVLSLRTGPTCALASGRRIERDGTGRAQWLVHLDETLAPTGQREPLNPPVPTGADPGGVTVAQIDSGVNYTLPAIAARLARTPDGELAGYDFWDMDGRPFDVDSARSPFFPLHHGTLVASVLVREAPQIRLLPYRYPRPDMSRMASLLDHAAAAGAKIVALPIGSNKEPHWTAFRKAAESHPKILFIVSAGNNSRNIDEQPLYPAAFPLENMIVVSSSTISGRLASGSNWGPKSVDLMVPAERVEVTDHRGARGRASGTSYAVPRVAALAARLLAKNPKWGPDELKAAIKALTGPTFERTGPKVRWGWIPNPADDD